MHDSAEKTSSVCDTLQLLLSSLGAEGVCGTERGVQSGRSPAPQQSDLRLLPGEGEESTGADRTQALSQNSQQPAGGAVLGTKW